MAEIDVPPATQLVSAPVSAFLSVLVIDDEKDVCESLRAMLTVDGHRTLATSDPEAALRLLRDEEFHVVILDLCLPQKSGLDLLREIRDVDAEIAVLILTGFPSIDSAASSIALSISAYLLKPVSLEALRGELDRVARHKGLAASREEALNRTIGQRARELRKLRGLTLKQIAKRTNLSASAVSQIERAASSTSVSSLLRLATALNVRISDLLGDF